MNTFSAENLLYILNHEKTGIDGMYDDGPIETEFELKPKDFLGFAEADFMSNSEHKSINALSNAKRALDCQADTLLVGFGFYKTSKKENWGFPRKLQLLKDFGIIAPRVLGKINRQRNLMEHEFVVPQLEKVEDFIDIVALFLAATDEYVYKFMYGKKVLFETEREFDFWSFFITLVYQKCKIQIETYHDIVNDEVQRNLFEIDVTDKLYKDLTKSFLKLTKFLE